MTSKIKNIIIVTVIAALLILAYIFFLKPTPQEEGLISSSNTPLSDTNVVDQNSLITKDLLSLLLSVKSIKLEDSIFADGAFINLKDSSILLTPSGDEGRLNPFAPVGFETILTPIKPPEKTP